MSLLVKGALGLGVAGVTTTGALYAGGLFRAKAEEKIIKVSVSKLLKDLNPEKRFITFSEGSNPKWKESWKNYNGRYREKGLDPLKVLTGKTFTENESAPNDFLSACKNLFSGEVVDRTDSKYLLFLEYCTRPTLVSDWIEDKGYEMVSQESGTDTDIWKSLWKKYKESANNTWTIAEISSYSEGQEAPDSFKKKCSDEFVIVQGNKDDPSVDRVFLYCSKKKLS